jgi:tetratricopeptide (TPR) repeat protein
LALLRQGQVRPAEEQITIAKQLSPNDPNVCIVLAQIYSMEKKWQAAEREYEYAINIDPHNADILGQFADFLATQKRSAEALNRVRRYVTTNPSDAKGHVILGALCFESKDYDSSQTELEKALSLDRNNQQAYLRLGKLYEVQGQTDLAIERYQSALHLQPRFAPLLTMVGNLYLGKGEFETARKYYVQSLEVDPNFAIAMANLAWLSAEEGKELDVALGMAQKAKSLMPELASISDTLGWVLYKKGNYIGALPLFTECVQKDPSSAQFHYHLGMALLATGQNARAKEQINTALGMKLNPVDLREAQKALAQVN